MTIRIEDLGEITYGGAVTLADWWDNKRIDEGKLTNKEVFKKAAFWTYLSVGLVATLSSIFGWMRQWSAWTEHISHGFFYDLPRQATNLYKSQSTQSKSRAATSDAVRQANLILNQRRALAAGSVLPAGIPAQRSYQPEMEKSVAF